MKKESVIPGTSSGFALPGLTAAVVILGVLSAFAMPRVHLAIERSRAGESFNYLASVKSSQERFHSRHGTYTRDLADLDLQLPAPRHFVVGTIDAGGTGSIEDSWTLTLTREGASDAFGAYTVSFTESGFNDNPKRSTISDSDHSHIYPL